MLILGRRPGDAIVIGNGIRIVLLACDHRGARIGIEAPDDVSIVREEILLEVTDENRRASDTAHARALLESINGAATPASD
jgi:carbon storage regulator